MIKKITVLFLIGAMLISGCGKAAATDNQQGEGSSSTTDNQQGKNITPTTDNPQDENITSTTDNPQDESLAGTNEDSNENLPVIVIDDKKEGIASNKTEEINNKSEDSDGKTEDNNIEDSDNTNVEIKTEAKDLTIIMVGDMLLHDRIEKYSQLEDGEYDYAPIFEHVADEIAGADIAIANQEVIIGGEELGVSGYPAFNAPFEFADALTEVGFDVVCQGSNHALDKGGKGIKNCLNYWEENHPEMAVLGIHDSAEDQNEIYIKEIPGTDFKIAILNYTYGTNGITLPADMPYAVDYISEGKVLADLKIAEENADFTIVCPHWGTEYSLESDSFQRKWANIFVENGADLIIGTHPHVIEPVDYIENEEGKSIPVYYSIGNFVNWTSGEGAGVSNRMVGGMAKIVLTCDEPSANDAKKDAKNDAKKGANNGLIIKENTVIPLVSHVTSQTGGITVYKLDDYTKELAGENEIINQAPDFSLEYCETLVEEVWPEQLK